MEPRAKRTSGDGKSLPSSSKSSPARPSRISAAVSDISHPSQSIAEVDVWDKLFISCLTLFGLSLLHIIFNWRPNAVFPALTPTKSERATKQAERPFWSASPPPSCIHEEQAEYSLDPVDLSIGLTV